MRIDSSPDLSGRNDEGGVGMTERGAERYEGGGGITNIFVASMGVGNFFVI
jgi:hypothetical protein